MSHKKLRHDKNCLNCGHHVEDRFCSQCGQENLELDDSAFHLALHYFQDLFHYNGKLWHTLKGFITKPGYVAKEYMDGKRRQNLNPIQSYVFTSTVFFIVFFFWVDPSAIKFNTNTKNQKESSLPPQEKEILAGIPDTAYVNELLNSLDRSTIDSLSSILDSANNELEIDLFNIDWDTISELNWLEKKLKAKSEQLEAEFEGDEQRAISSFLSELLHSLPQLFFLSLPFFAFFLKLLYWRSQRSSYVEHFIFSFYQYAYLFLYALLLLGLGVMPKVIAWNFIDKFWGWMMVLGWLYPFIHLYLSMRRFYSDEGFKLFVRFIALLFLFVSAIIFLFVLIAFVTFLI